MPAREARATMKRECIVLGGLRKSVEYGGSICF